MAVQESIIDIRNITAYCGTTCVFSGFSLQVPNGCNTAILGPNGSGKSTLMKLLSRDLYPVFDGDSHVRIFGRDRWNIMELRARLGIVSHDLQHDYLPEVPGLNVILSGFYASIDVWKHQQFSSDDLEKAVLVMQQLGIGELKNRSFCSMSTGQQRRFLLGRSLINNPEALLLDEPTTGLDMSASLHYLQTLQSMIRSGKTVVLVTHHLHEIPPEIDRVVLLKKGRIFADGKKSEVLISEILSDLFDYPLQVIAVNGYYQVLPAG
ncbi:MAG: ATP-binding cassette domain-containing protein [Chlorobiaceae bacterium]